jgi:hypothetical protein
MNRMDSIMQAGAVFCLGVFFAIAAGAGLFLYVGGLDCCKSVKANAPDCCKDEGKLPKNALAPGHWYKPARPIAWSWNSRQWIAGQARVGATVLSVDAPLYCVERRGSVAVLRGAVHGVILVPDGPSTRHFVEVAGAGEIGELGEQPDP